MTSTVLKLGFALILGSASSPTLAQADGKPLELPLRQVAIFNSGVAFFERAGQVDGDAEASLRFRTQQMDDVIKSLIVRDLGGGQIGVVSYGSKDPIERTLKSFAVDVTGNPDLFKLLEQLRGQHVHIQGERTTSGQIVSVERQKTAHGDQVVEQDMLTILAADGLQRMPLAGVTSMRLDDARLDGEFRQALATLATSRDSDRKSVELRFLGQGRRDVRVGYLLEAPVWRTSYRVALGDDGKAQVQGWANVENQTEEDWDQVRLSLVSGQPISFTMDMYTPIYVPRPHEEMLWAVSIAAPEFADLEAFKENVARGEYAARALRAQAPAPAAGEALGKFDRSTHFTFDLDANMGVFGGGSGGGAGAATTSEVGELFEYQIRTPVTLARQQSAMLPIVDAQVAIERLGIYNPAVHPKHPLHGFRITNDTQLHLTRGPITIFDDGAYAGDAKLPYLRPGDDRIIAYALDLGVEVEVKEDPRPQRLQSVRLTKGVMITLTKSQRTATYEIRNKTTDAKTMLIEQLYDDSWKLMGGIEPVERSGELSRFRVPVPAADKASLTVEIERIDREEFNIGGLSLDGIALYLNATVISEPVRQALERVVALQGELATAARSREQAAAQLQSSIQEQSRLRENIKTLPANSDAYKRQMTKFDQVETAIEERTAEVRKFEAEQEQRRRALEEFIAGLDVQ